jgi:hypothetical protein
VLSVVVAALISPRISPARKLGIQEVLTLIGGGV